MGEVGEVFLGLSETRFEVHDLSMQLAHQSEMQKTGFLDAYFWRPTFLCNRINPVHFFTSRPAVLLLGSGSKSPLWVNIQ